MASTETRTKRVDAAGKGDSIPGFNQKAYRENFPDSLGRKRNCRVACQLSFDEIRDKIGSKNNRPG